MIYSVHLMRHLRLAIADNIKNLRAKQDLSSGDLCAKAGISELTLSYFETGHHEIRLPELLRIACALDVKVAELMD